MANPSNRDGYTIDGQVDHRSREAPEVRNFPSRSAPIFLIKIGNYQIRSQNESHLTARWYYTSRRLIWEISENGLKKKIDIDWSNISAMRVGYGTNPQILRIELYRRPRFYGEAEGRTRVHTSWNRRSDFTDGQASASRIHYLEFPNGTLERSMEPLFTLDHRLRDLTERPFPSLKSPFFMGDIAGASQAPRVPLPPKTCPLSFWVDRIPPGHSSVPSVSSNSNLMDWTSTGPQSANDGYQQLLPSSPSSSMQHLLERIIGDSALPSIGMTPDQEPGMEHLAPRSGTMPNLELRRGHPAQPGEMASTRPQSSNDGYPQPSPSSPSSRPMHRLELIMPPSAVRRMPGITLHQYLSGEHPNERGEQVHLLEVRIGGHSAQNAAASSNDPGNTRHGREGYHQASSSNSHQDSAPGHPSSSS